MHFEHLFTAKRAPMRSLGAGLGTNTLPNATPPCGRLFSMVAVRATRPFAAFIEIPAINFRPPSEALLLILGETRSNEDDESLHWPIATLTTVQICFGFWGKSGSG